MRWLLIAAVVSASCQSKKEKPEKTDPPAAAQPAAPPAPKGCDAVLTSAEIEEICGAKTPLVADVLEKKERILCSRRGGPVDRWLALTIANVTDVAAAEKLTGGVPEGEVRVELQPGGSSKRLTARARKGTVTMTLVTLVPADKPGLCTQEQLETMARRVYGRLDTLR